MAKEPAPFRSQDRFERPQPLIVQVEQALRQAIAEGKFPSGKLPTAIELAETFGVSRETVRRAAEVLQREGIVQKFRRRGTEISNSQRPLQLPTKAVRPLLAYIGVNYASSANEADHLNLGSSSLMLQGAIESAGVANCEFIVRSVRPGTVRAAVTELVEQRGIQGAILAGVAEEKALRRLGGRALPLVLLDHDMPVPKTSSVRDDSAHGAQLAVAHLAEGKHREIAYVHLEEADLNPWRLRGYRQGMTAAGLRRRRAHELFVTISPKGAESAAEQLLQLTPRPTAVVCFSNSLARWLIIALRKLGLRVPEDVSVIGCGGEEITDLSTCQADWYDIGRHATRLLLQRLQQPTLDVEHLQVVPQLRVGLTTAAHSS